MILSIETATEVCSIALHSNKKLVAYEEIHLQKSHSGYLTVMIEHLMNSCGVAVTDVEGIAVSEGPGSYTGLRIGVSTAKGLCYAWEKPLIAISTLEAMAISAIKNVPSFIQHDHIFCPMLDARRMEVYLALYDKSLSQTLAPQPVIIDNNSLESYSDKHKIICFGNGAKKCKDVLLHENFLFIDGYIPSAKGVGILAQQAYNDKRFVDLAYFEPFYLKTYQAARATKNKILGSI
ncbi:MAG: tRNA (adenosine(37)-N6)-threonylcarbamoyltransferase complex dimerization subunit type 1 TsaB [Bacteroidota bacterium]